MKMKEWFFCGKAKEFTIDKMDVHSSIRKRLETLKYVD
jgi:hypothetical protein